MKRTAQLLTVLIVAQLMGCEGNDEWNSLLDAGDTYQSATMSDCIRYVDYNAEFGGTGLSWETAHESLVSAIESAERQDLTGCEIWISGDVVEDREVAVEQMNPQNAFHVYSGFRGNEHHRPNFANPVVLQTKDFARIRRGLNRFSSGADDGNVTQKDYEAIKALDVSPFHEVLADSSMMTPPSVTPLSGGTCSVCSGTQSIIGRLEVEGGSDANGTTNTGYIEIGNSLRLDSNEVITNSNTTLYLQNDNDGDLRVDNSTLMVDSSANRVGIGTTSPATTLHVNGKARATDIDVDGYTTTDQLRVKTTTESGYVRVGNFDDLTQNDLWAFWGSQLSVNGKATIKNLRAEKISAGEITVKTQWWADFVFDDDYDLMSLDKVEDYISKNGHLPDVPSEGEVKKDGISIARSQAILLQKVEELTLHLIEQNKRLEEQNEKLARMDNIVSKQARRIESLKNRGASSDK